MIEIMFEQWFVFLYSQKLIYSVSLIDHISAPHQYITVAKIVI